MTTKKWEILLIFAGKRHGREFTLFLQADYTVAVIVRRSINIWIDDWLLFLQSVYKDRGRFRLKLAWRTSRTTVKSF